MDIQKIINRIKEEATSSMNAPFLWKAKKHSENTLALMALLEKQLEKLNNAA